MNIFLLQVGVESGYSEGLKTIRKNLTINETIEFAKRCSLASFHYQLYWSFVIGFPWEMEQHVIKTINFAFNCAALSGSQQPQINNFAPYSGTELVNNYKKYGLKKIESCYYDNSNWYKQFLSHTNIPQINRDYIFQYLHDRHNNPDFPVAQYIQLPNGSVLNNILLQ